VIGGLSTPVSTSNGGRSRSLSTPLSSASPKRLHNSQCPYRDVSYSDQLTHAWKLKLWVCVCARAFSGGPAVPEVALTSVNQSYLELTWPVPFTWSDTNITGYKVFSNFSINGQTSWSLLTNSLSLRPDPAAPQCTLYQFSVVARNRLGSSSPGTVLGGFHMGEFRLNPVGVVERLP